MFIEPRSYSFGQLNLIPVQGAAMAQIGEDLKHSLFMPGIFIEFANYEAYERHFQTPVLCDL